MRKYHFLIFFMILNIFITTGCINTEKPPVQNSLLNDGYAAPNFSLFDSGGNSVTLEQFAGKKVYIKYWASWCSICLAGLKEVNNLVSESHDFEVVTIVSPRHKGEMKKEDFTSWFDSLAYDNITVLFDENGLWSQEFNVLSYPTSYYIGSDGVLVKSIIGHQANDIIIKEMEEIL